MRSPKCSKCGYGHLSKRAPTCNVYHWRKINRAYYYFFLRERNMALNSGSSTCICNPQVRKAQEICSLPNMLGWKIRQTHSRNQCHHDWIGHFNKCPTVQSLLIFLQMLLLQTKFLLATWEAHNYTSLSCCNRTSVCTDARKRLSTLCFLNKKLILDNQTHVVLKDSLLL